MPRLRNRARNSIRLIFNWTIETSLIAPIVSDYFGNPDRLDVYKQLFEYYQQTATGLKQIDVVNTLSIQLTAFDHRTKWDIMFKTFAETPLSEHVRQALFTSWRDNIVQQAKPMPTWIFGRSWHQPEPRPSWWLIWLIDSIVDEQKGTGWFQQQMAEWLTRLPDTEQELGEDYGFLRLLTSDLAKINGQEQKSYPRFHSVVIRPGDLTSPDQDSRRTYLKQYAANDLLSQVMDYWKAHLKNFVPRPERAEKSVYTSHAQWMTALKELSLTDYETLFTSGYRVCLIYNLAIADRQKQPLLSQQTKIIENIGRVIQKWRQEDSENPILAYLLEHSYSEQNISLSNLKQSDFAKASVLLNAAEQNGCQAFLCLVTYLRTSYGETIYYGRYSPKYDLDEDDFEEYDVDEEEVFAHSFITATGEKINVEKIRLDEEKLFAETPLREGPGRGYSISEATGNEGATKDLWYERGAVIIWPKDREFDLITRMDLNYGLHALKRSLQKQNLADSDYRQKIVRLADHILENLPNYRQNDISKERGYRVAQKVSAYAPQSIQPQSGRYANCQADR